MFTLSFPTKIRGESMAWNKKNSWWSNNKIRWALLSKIR